MFENYFSSIYKKNAVDFFFLIPTLDYLFDFNELGLGNCRYVPPLENARGESIILIRTYFDLGTL